MFPHVQNSATVAPLFISLLIETAIATTNVFLFYLFFKVNLSTWLHLYLAGMFLVKYVAKKTETWPPGRGRKEEFQSFPMPGA
jgi:hypothetical protein